MAFAQSRVDGDCPGRYVLTRTWASTDRCGNATARSQVITVVDTTPPVVARGEADLHCLWPPSHWFVCFGREDFAPVVTDNCSEPVTWSFAGCASDQPADSTGDGDTEADCVVAPDGSGACVRSERQGGVPAGRRYAVAIVAVDACGNASEATPIGNVHVPHDQSPAAKSCRKSTREGRRPNQGLPW
jgi:hypothetical protein